MASWPTRMLVCTASGLSMITIRRVEAGGSIDGGGGSVPRAQSPNTRCAAANASSLVTSPTMARIMLFGRKYCVWNACRSSRVSEPSESSVPMPGSP